MFFLCINLDRKVSFMKDTIKFSESCLFPNNIADITSISMECNYQCEGQKVFGDFLIEGTYRAYELSINQENFSYKLPFEYSFVPKINDDSALVEINDFTYEIDNRELKVDIEYEITADVIEEEREELVVDDEFERFIVENDVDVIDLTEENVEESEIEENVEELPEENISIEDDKLEESTEVMTNELRNDFEKEEETKAISDDKITNTIINNIRTNDDEYITYHIYVCNENDTLDSIASKFKISIDVLKNYNDIDKITTGVKLIIPGIDE